MVKRPPGAFSSQQMTQQTLVLVLPEQCLAAHKLNYQLSLWSSHTLPLLQGPAHFCKRREGMQAHTKTTRPATADITISHTTHSTAYYSTTTLLPNICLGSQHGAQPGNLIKVH